MSKYYKIDKQGQVYFDLDLLLADLPKVKFEKIKSLANQHDLI